MYSALLVGGAMVVTVLLVVLAGRTPRAKSGEFDAEGLGFVGSVLNALFIAIVAFYIVIAWQNSDIAGRQASGEAAELVDLYWHADALPQQQRDRVRALVRDYTSEVIDRDWPAMAAGDTDTAGGALLTSLRQAATTSDPAVAQTIDRNLRIITDSRRARLEHAAGQDAMLLLLLYGSFASGALMVAYPVLMGLKGEVRHVTAMAVLAAAIGIVIWAEIGLLHPFSGMLSVGPDAFQAAQAEFTRIP